MFPYDPLLKQWPFVRRRPLSVSAEFLKRTREPEHPSRAVIPSKLNPSVKRIENVGDQFLLVSGNAKAFVDKPVSVTSVRRASNFMLDSPGKTISQRD